MTGELGMVASDAVSVFGDLKMSELSEMNQSICT